MRCDGVRPHGRLRASIRCACVLFVATFAATRPAFGAAQDPPHLPTLRHLAFRVEVSVQDAYELSTLPTRRLIRGQLVDQPPAKPVGTVEKDATFKGSIICDVVAATGDGGLVVDVKEDAEGRSAPTLRVAVGANGHLSYDPRQTIFDEEIALLQLLARSIVGPNAHEKGSSWTVEDAGKGFDTKTRFLVTGAAGPEIELQSDRECALLGAVQGNIIYDQPKLVPRSADLVSVVRTQTQEGRHVVRTTMSILLLEDAFAAR